MDPFSALRHADGFMMIDAFAGAEFAKDICFFVLQFRRNELQNRLANDLLRTVAEDARGCVVPTDDCAGQVFADDRIVRRVDDCREMETSIEGCRYCLFGGFWRNRTGTCILHEIGTPPWTKIGCNNGTDS